MQRGRGVQQTATPSPACCTRTWPGVAPAVCMCVCVCVCVCTRVRRGLVARVAAGGCTGGDYTHATTNGSLAMAFNRLTVAVCVQAVLGRPVADVWGRGQDEEPAGPPPGSTGGAPPHALHHGHPPPHTRSAKAASQAAWSLVFSLVFSLGFSTADLADGSCARHPRGALSKTAEVRKT